MKGRKVRGSGGRLRVGGRECGVWMRGTGSGLGMSHSMSARSSWQPPGYIRDLQYWGGYPSGADAGTFLVTLSLSAASSSVAAE